MLLKITYGNKKYIFSLQALLEIRYIKASVCFFVSYNVKYEIKITNRSPYTFHHWHGPVNIHISSKSTPSQHNRPLAESQVLT